MSTSLAQQLLGLGGTPLTSRVVRRPARAARNLAVCADAARPNWYPGSKVPAHLKSELPGDYGFDPLNLGADPKDLEWYVQAELMHARWAMLGLAGMVAPEVIQNPFVAGPMPNWAEAPFYKDYLADSTTLFATQMFLMNWAEVRRWQDIKKPGSVSTDPLFEANKCTGTDVGYPGGGWFDPLNKGASTDMKELRAKEIANGRLAMVATFGCLIQERVTHAGPVANLKAHLAYPYHVTIFSNFHPFF